MSETESEINTGLIDETGPHRNESNTREQLHNEISRIKNVIKAKDEIYENEILGLHHQIRHCEDESEVWKEINRAQ